METYEDIMDDNAADTTATAYEDAYEEWEEYEEDLLAKEDELEEEEDDIEEWEQEQAWDDAAGAHDVWLIAEATYENAADRVWFAEEDFEDAEEELWEAEDQLWEANFMYDNATSNADWEIAEIALDEANQRYNDAFEWWEAAQDEEEEANDDWADQEDAWEDAEDDFALVDYDPDFEYATYEDWELPDDYDNFFDYAAPENLQTSCVDGEVWSMPD